MKMKPQNMQHYRIMRLRGIPTPKYFCQSKLIDMQKHMRAMAEVKSGMDIIPLSPALTTYPEGNYYWYNDSMGSSRVVFMPLQPWQKK